MVNTGSLRHSLAGNSMCAMARSHVARYRRLLPGTAVPARACAGRRIRVACATAVLTAAGAAVAVLPLIAGAARAEPVQAAGPPLGLTVNSMSPSYATAGRTITVSGQVHNATGSAISGLSVQLQSSRAALVSENELQNYASGFYQPAQSPVGRSAPLRRLRAHATLPWTIRLPVSDLRIGCFGVYPLTAHVSDPTGTYVAIDPIPLPYWPRSSASCGVRRPAPFRISWIWPLIDSPHQGPCPGLTDNDLARSIQPTGRLGSLLAVGAQYSARARLTWAIDPALLDNTRTMTQPYQVENATCTGAAPYPASPAAARWLARLVQATSRQQVFVTPYADVDVAALPSGSTDLRAAFADGQNVAGTILGRNPVPESLPASDRRLSAVAWPANGIASAGVLENFGALKISTVILATPPYYSAGAVSSGVDGAGTRLHILYADNTISQLLATANTAAASRGTIFSVSQQFLAQTAMIVAEEPALARPIVVTPPRRWNAPRQLASSLLAETVSAPWLAPSTVNQMVTLPARTSRLQLSARTVLPRKLLSRVAEVESKIALLQSIRKYQDPTLNRAVYGVESSAWSGHGVEHAWALLARTSRYVTDQFAGLSIGNNHVIYVTLGGRVGSVTVSIRNTLDYPVKVRLRVTHSNDSVTTVQPRAFYQIPAHNIYELKLTVHSAQTGAATLRLNLSSPGGTLLPDKPLIMEIRASNFGTVALVICAAALAVFVFASAAQALRHGRPEPTDPPESQPSPADPAEPGCQQAARSPETVAPPVAYRGSVDLLSRQDQPDNVGTDRSRLSQPGPAIAIPGPPAPQPSPTEES